LIRLLGNVLIDLLVVKEVVEKLKGGINQEIVDQIVEKYKV